MEETRVEKAGTKWHRARDLSPEEKRNELEQVLESDAFAKSEQLRSFLRYVCTMEITGRASELNEYLVGTEALRRPPSYSPGEDSSVRSRAWELRNKLLKLYSSERQASAVRIELPKGGYAPHFLVRTVETEGVVETPATRAEMPPAPAEKTARAVWTYWLAGIAATAAIVFAMVYSKAAPERRSDLSPVLVEAWGPLLQHDANDLVVLANGYYLLVRPNVPATFRSRLQYPAPPELYEQYRSRRPLDRQAKLSMIPSSNVVQMGYANGLVSLTNLIARAGVTQTTSAERVITYSSLRNRNVILLGAPQESIFVSDLLRDAEYVFDYDPNKDIVIRRRNQKPSESGYFVSHNADSQAAVTYGLITVRPSLESSATSKQTVILSGITSVGGQAAAEFFSSGKNMQAVKAALAKKGIHGFPPAYQVLIRCRSFDSLLTSFEFVDVVPLKV